MITVAVDSQAAIRAVGCIARRGKAPSEEGRRTGRAIPRLQSKGKRVKLVWVKFHIGVEGNALADEHSFLKDRVG